MLQGQAGSQTRSSSSADEPLVLAAIDRSDDAWLSAETVAAVARLPLERVQAVLDTTPADLIVAPAGSRAGGALYSTRGHYRAATRLLRRYLDAVLLS